MRISITYHVPDFTRFVSVLTSAAFLCASSHAQTTPTGGQVTAGNGSISQVGVTTTINQESQRLAINWTTFSSVANEAIVFNQPNASAIALNRVTGSSPSTLLGNLTANGQVFILNPNGVLFGAGSQVSVGGLVASTLSLSNADFLADNYIFSGSSTPGGSTGSVVNLGNLTATPGGYLALLAPEVRNEGVITATFGTALLAAGNKITLNLDNGSLLGYSIDQGALQALASNHHLIRAGGGQVLLSARAYDALTTAAVNNTGVIEARTLENRNGRILLLADMQTGTVNVDGRLDASAPNGGNGGFIETSAAHVKVADTALITTAAPAGRTGTWLIDPTDYTIAATGGNISGAALSANLGASNVTILSSSGSNASGNGDIHVNDAVSWSANTLTLTAARDININAVMTASGTSALTLNTATANGADGGVAGGTVKVGMAPNAGGFTGRVDFGARSGTGFLTINGNGYTVINSLGAAGSVTGTDLQGLNGNLSDHYALGANIDASATSGWNAGAGFAPVNNFTGALNGLGHTVSGLTINRPSTNTIGLFGSSSGTISNIGLVGGSVIGGYNVGSLAGQTQPGGSIRNVYSTANVSATGDEAGGLVGVNRQTITGSYATGIVTAVGYDPGGLVGWNLSGTISHSYATGNASSSATGWSGGLVGYNDAGTIDNSYATGNASSAAEIAGGLVGGAINGGTISNSYATGNATSTDASGGLVGYNNGATITNAYATGNVNTTTYGAGGLVGRHLNGSITNAYATGSVTGGTDQVGGLVGESRATINNAYATGSATGTSNVGGLVGQSTGNITNAYATGPVTGTTNVGGLIGLSTAGTITSSYWNKETTGRTTSAGLADSFGKTTAELRQASTFTGWDLATTGGSSAVWRIYEGNTAPLLRSFLTTLNLTLDYDGTAAPLTNIGSYSVPGGADGSKIFGTPDYTGALTLSNTGAVGSYLASTPVSGLYSNQQGYDLASTATRTIATTGSAAGTVRLDNPITWTNGTLILNATGSIDLNNRALTGDRVELNAGTTIANAAAIDLNRFTLTAGTWSQVNTTLPAFSADDFRLTGGTFVRVLGGDGTGGNPYQLTDIYGLQGVGSGGMLGYSYVLANDIAASSTSGWNAGAGFAPITGGFSGTLNGLGHTVSGLTINRPAEDDVGLFRRSSGAISNLGLVGGSITGSNRVGAFVGRTTGGSLSHVYATGTVAALQWHVGGLVGFNDGGSISDSYTTGNVTAQVRFAGGLVGYHENGGTISDSYATGDITAVSGYAGGLAGWQRGATSSITRSYATGAVSVTANVDNLTAAGGLAGANEGGTISDSHATGAVSSNNGRAGGLVGFNYNSGIITRSYATGNVTATGTNVGGLAGHNYNSGTITNSYATGNVTASGNNVGGLVGQNQLSGSILNAYATGSVTGANGVGGLAGRLNTGTITNTYATGSVNGTTNAGGLIGEITTGTITSSYWNKDTTGQTSSAGLADSFGKTTAEMRQASTFAGWDLATTGGSSAVWRIYEGNTAPLLRSFLTSLTLTADYDGSATPLTNIGSYSVPGGADGSKIFGTPDYTGALTLSNTGATGSYLASTSVSGLYSNQQGYDLASTATRTIATTGSAAGTVRLDNPITWTNGTLILNATGSIDLNNRALTGDRVEFNAGTTIANTAAIDVNRFTLTAGTWSQVNATLPAFSADDFRLTGGTFVRVLGGDGTGGNPYQLTDIYGLQGVGSNGMLGNSYVLANDITASAATGWNSGAGFAPIANGTTQFSGTFNGQNHTISLLTINRPTQDYIGLFGFSSGTISNVGLIGGSMTGKRYVGGLLGSHGSGAIANVYATSTVSALERNAGGLAGYNDGGSISHSYATGNVTAQLEYAGGLVGHNRNGGSIANAYATGAVGVPANISTLAAVGGLVGYNEGGSITNAYATGAVSTNASYAGGLAGFNYNSGSITNAYATGNVIAGGGYVGGLVGYNYVASSISNAYATGSVTGGTYVGGLVGRNTANAMIANTYATGLVTGSANTGGLVGTHGTGAITASYWNRDTTGQTTSAGLAGTFGKTTTEIMQSSTFVGWNLATTGGSSAVWRIYEGNTAPLLRGFLTALTLSDTTLSYNGTTQTGAAIATSGLRSGTTASGRNAGSYNAFSHQQGYDLTGGALTVTPASLVITTSNVTKTYDGGLSALGTAVATSGTSLFGSDTFSGGIFAFTDKNAGTGKTVTTTGVTVNDGNNAANYIVSYVNNTTSTITPRSLIATATGVDKTYDGTTAATVVFGDNRVIGDVLTLSGSASFADKNAATGKTVSVNGIGATGTDSANYTVNTTATTTATITPKALTVGGLTAANKVYDGTTAATVSAPGATYSGLISGDAVSVSATGLFADKNAATGKTVTLASSYSGADVNNYAITNQATTTGTITPRSLMATATGVNKTYDGTTTATVIFGDNRIAGDVLMLSGSASFADKNAATGKTVSVNGIGATGTDSANYTLNATATTTATITPKALTVGGLTASNKVYDGTTAATVSTTGASYTGLIAGDNLSVSATGAFFDKNAATGKTVGLTSNYTGADVSNYTITSQATTTATITPASLVLTTSNVAKTYDGNLGALGTAVAAGGTQLFGSDTISGGTFAFTDKNAGTGKTVTTTGVTVSDGNLGANYLVTYANNTTSTITPRSLIATATGQNKVYDATTATTVTFSDNRVAGDVLTLAGTAAFADKNAATAKTVSVTGIGATGTDAANYILTSTTATTIASITPKALTVGGLTAGNKVYDGTTASTVSTTGASYTGLIAGDNVSVSATGVFSDKNAATGKTVALSSSYTGADAANYTITGQAATTATITPKALSVTASNDIKIADGTAYTGGNGVTYTGFVAGETASVLTGTLTYAGSSQGASTQGLYVITPGGLTSTNYTLTFTNGALTITAPRKSLAGMSEPYFSALRYVTDVDTRVRKRAEYWSVDVAALDYAAAEAIDQN